MRVRVCARACSSVRVFVCVYVHLCVFVCMYVCFYVFIRVPTCLYVFCTCFVRVLYVFFCNPNQVLLSLSFTHLQFHSTIQTTTVAPIPPPLVPSPPPHLLPPARPPPPARPCLMSREEDRCSGVEKIRVTRLFRQCRDERGRA